MSADQRSTAKLRLFIALDLPEEVRAQIVTWQRRELTDPVLRPVPAEALHVTLCFLGSREEQEVEQIATLVEATAPLAPRFTANAEPVARPRGKPRLFAIELVSEAAVELQADLAERLSEAGLYTPERRGFWPHITVARVRGRADRKRPQPVARRPAALPAAIERPFASVRLALYRSHLRAQGAHYEALHGIELRPDQ